MLGGRGFYRGSSVLVSGAAGSGKSTIAAKFVEAACRRGERALYLAFEESPRQIQRNMRSVGIDLAPFERKGLLRFRAARPTHFGLEMHLVSIHDTVREFRPSIVIVDPLNNMLEVGSDREVKTMLTRLIDFLKMENVSTMFTSLTGGGENSDQTEVGVSSLMDAWLVVRNVETGGERNRALYVLKARGLAHSNQVREFVLSDDGLDLVNVYLGKGEVLVGSARLAQETHDRAEAQARKEEVELKRRNLDRQRAALRAQILALQADLQAREEEARLEIAANRQRETKRTSDRTAMARSRFADARTGNGG
jgi:circadian clock protein KaiC